MPSGILESIIQSTRKIDPALADVLIKLAREQSRLATIVDPAPELPTKVRNLITPPPLDVTEFTYLFTGTNLVLTWEAPSPEIILYELRQGSDWDTATRLLTTGTLTAILDPIAVGTTTYLLRGLNDQGTYSINPISLDVIVPPIGTFQVNSSTIGNNVILTWSIPESIFNIAYYLIERDSDEIGRATGTFIAITESAGGTFTYSITAYDIAGNASAASLNTIAVPDPPDFVLTSEFESAFAGTKTRAVTDGSSLFVCINNTETYQQHFVNNGFASPQAQITAGYPLWLEPFPTTASYKETFDIGTIETTTIVNLSYLYELLSGTFTVGFSTRVSDDGISWSAANTNLSFFVASVRYIEVTVSFTGSSNLALMRFYHFHIAVSVKLEMDSGTISALLSDVSGTVVTFNKAFKDVDSITVSTLSVTAPYTAIYYFVDVANPTSFAVFVFDSAGNRASATVEWKARGVI